MGLTEGQTIELNRLLLERGLYTMGDNTSPNYQFLYEALNSQQYDDQDQLTAGYTGVILEGSSRSTKTWSGVDFIIYICLFVEKNCTINIYRETYNEFKTTLYDDFRRRLSDFGLDNPFIKNKEVGSFKINGNSIYFLGDGKEGGGCDYAFFNEMIKIPKRVFDHVEMRCRRFWWGDYNPSVTQHWIFDSVIPRPDVGYLHTTFRANKFITPNEKNKILGYEPWKPGSYKIIDHELYYRGQPITDEHMPPPHPVNIDNGTADEYMWKVYGLGLRGAMQGVIFKNIKWIDKMPDMASTFANDFGFTADPNCLGRYAEDEHNIWIEPLMYSPCDNDADLAAYFESVGVDKNTPIACDSSDKYTGENKGTIEMVKGLKKRGFKAFKISKTKSIMFWLGSMKKKKIHIVRNKFYTFVKKEQENYRMKEIHGILINQPMDEFNHFWDMARYGHMSHNMTNRSYSARKSVRRMGVNY